MNRRVWLSCRAENTSVVPSGDRIAPAPRSVTSDASAPMLASKRRGVGAAVERQGAHTTSAETSATPSAPATAHGSARRHAGTSDGAGAVADDDAAIAGSSEAGSSRINRASPMSRNRFFGSRARQRRISEHDRRRRPGRQRAQVDVLAEHRDEQVGHVLAVKRPPAGEHLVEHDAERPDVRALVDRAALGLLGRHVGRGAENHAHLRSSRASVIVGELASALAAVLEAPAGSIAFARPKSSTFTVPSARTLIFAGFRSRWMMPCSCAASRASAIWRAMGSASARGGALQLARQSRARDPRLKPSLGARRSARGRGR